MKKYVLTLLMVFSIFRIDFLLSQINSSSLQFDGIDDYVNMGDPSNGSLDFGSNDAFTIMAWINTTNTPATYMDIISKRRIVSGNHYEGYMMALNSSGKIYFVIEDINGLYTQMNGNITVNDGNWHLITATRSITNDNVNVYVDGVLDISLTDNTTATLANTTDFVVGQWPTYSRYFNGKIDDISIWNTAMTPSEISTILNCPPNGSEPNLNSFWNFEETSGTIVNDASIYLNSGTLQNGVIRSNLFPTYTCVASSQCPNYANYPFNGNANDISNHNLHATITGATLTADRFGNPNSAYSFNGVSDYIELPEDFDFVERTINVWFKADTTISTPNHIYDSDHPGMLNASTKMWVWTNGGVPKVGMSTGNGTINQHNEPINLDQWYMGTIVVGSDVKFYLDANLIATFPLNPGCAVSGNSTALIGSSRLIDRFFQGDIDDTEIFDCALNQTSIDSLYNLTYTPPPLPLNCIVAEYEFSGNVADSSGNSLHGTNNGAVLTTDRFGNPNSAYSFDGNNDYIELPSDFDTPERTINVWFKAEQLSTSPKHIYDSDHPGMVNASTKMWVWMQSGQAKVGMSTGSSNINQHNEPININQWYMGTIVVGSDVKFYLNSNLIATFSLHSGCAVAGNSTALFGSSRLIDRFFDGDIDDATIYDCALSQAQIDSLYDGFVSVPIVTCDAAKYYFTGDANDDGSFNLDGTPNAVNLTTDLFGSSNSAYEFTNPNSSIELPDDFDFSSRTINLWFKPSFIDTNLNYLYYSDNPNLNNGSTLLYVTNDDTMGKVIGYSVGTVSNNSYFTPVSENQWYMASITVSPSDIHYYLNGQLISSSSFNPGFSGSGIDHAFIGNNYDLNGNFNGIIDNVTIYQCAMTSTFIDSLFQLGSAALQPAFCDLEASSQITLPNCYGSATGAIELTVIGNTGPVSITWSDGSTSPNQFNITSGNYSVFITDTSGCDTTINYTILDPDPITITTSVIEPSCNLSNGSIDISIANGTSPYQMDWSTGDNTSLTDSIPAGIYYVEVTDANGCMRSISVSLNNSNGITLDNSIISNTSCPYNNDGSIDISLSGGTTPFNYLWSNGATTEDISNLLQGVYDVMITDASGCLFTANFEIESPDPFSYSFTTQPSFCNSSNGSVALNVSGGTSPYSYQWVNGATTSSISGLAIGFYSVTVTDDHGCTFTDIAVINEYGGPQIYTDNIVQPSCGGNDGQVEISIYAGVPPFTYLWSNTSTSEDLLNASNGMYSVVVTGSNGCSSINVYDLEGTTPDSIQICIISVDSLTQRNLIIWEKPVSSDINYFNIYKETSTANVYNLVGMVDYDSLSVFLDSTANPQVRGWRYKLTAVDFCGNESMQSQFHKTLHLNANLGVGGVVNLDWDEYSGFSYGTFYIWRYDTANDWIILDSIPSNLFSYTDLTPPAGMIDYYIEVRKSSGCDPSRSGEISSRSNTKTQTISGNGIDENSIGQLSVYPNPANEFLNIRLKTPGNDSNYSIYDVSGKLILSGTIIGQPIHIKNLSTGLYTIKVKTDTEEFNQKFIKN